MPLHGDEKRRYENARAREKRAKDIKEIGPPPAVENQQRRDECRYSLRAFLLQYLSALFYLELSDAHERLISEVEAVVLRGKRIVVAMPRGSGKTTILVGAILWAALYGHRKFPMLITADDKKFKGLLRGIKTQLETNDNLLADFPEVCHPIRALERTAIRAIGQTVNGVSTYLEWGTDRIVFPTTEHTKKAGNAGSVIGGGGLTGAAVRGGVFTTPSGDNVRPDAVLIDDPQTRSSAKSESQTQERWDIINGDILGMSGPGKDIAVLVSCTVIYEDDLAERLLDPDRASGWQRIRERMIISWPENLDAWDTYGDLDRQEAAGEIEAGSAHAYYLQNREELDKGAVCYWEQRKKPGYESAIESAMSDYLRDARSFLAEYQNEPTQKVGEGVRRLDAKAIARRTNGYEKGVIPADCVLLTSHIDVQGRLLYWMVCGFTESFGCYVVDYGTTPEQPAGYFTLQTARRDFARMFPDADENGRLRGAIVHTVDMLGDRKYRRTDGADLGITRGLVDARYETDNVELALQEVGRSNWIPSYGVTIKATANPLTKWTKRPGAIRGDHWLAQKPIRRNLVSAFVDANYWKSDAAKSLTCDKQHTRSTSLYKAPPSKHQLLAEHMAAEAATVVLAEGKGQTVEEWTLIKAGLDNHWFDNLYNCRAAASMSGLVNKGSTNGKKESGPKRRRQRVRKIKT